MRDEAITWMGARSVSAEVLPRRGCLALCLRTRLPGAARAQKIDAGAQFFQTNRFTTSGA